MCEHSHIQNIGLLIIVEQLKEIARAFQDIRFTQIYRKRNQVGDKISKEGLKLMEDDFVLSKFHVGYYVVIRHSYIDVF
jgi:hypothetical protein